MKKGTRAAIFLGTLLLCAAAFAAGSYAKEKLIEEAVQEMQDQQEARQQERDRQCGYILIQYQINNKPDTTQGGNNNEA